jgi:anti-anti-sigma factor
VEVKERLLSVRDLERPMQWHAETISGQQGWAGFGLTVTVTKRDTLRASLRLVGELDGASAALFTACFEHQLDSGRRYLRADLSGLAFIDTAGLEVVVDAHHAACARHGTLILTGLTARTRRLVELVGLDTVLLIAGDLPDITVPVA